MTKETVQQYAFQIIAFAGEAIDSFVSAIKLNRSGQIEESWEKYNEGSKQLNQCHEIQTQLIVEESRGGEIPYSLIMTHAQDHFNTAYNWQVMCGVFMIKDDINQCR